MSEKSYNDIFKKDSVKNVYLFYGVEEYLKRTYFNILKSRVIENGMEDFNYHIFDYKNLDVSEFLNAIENMPVMSEKKMIVLNDVDFGKMREDMSEFLKKTLVTLPYYCVLAIYSDTVQIDAKNENTREFLKLINENDGTAVNFEKAQERDLIGWIYKHFRHEGFDTDNETIKYFLSVTDNSMINLKNEIDKLCGYVPEKQIKKRHIDEMVSKTITAMVFDLTNALVAGENGNAFKILNDLYNLKYDVFEIAGPVYWGFITMYKVKTASVEGISISQMIKELSLKEFIVKKYLRLCENIEIQKLRKIIQKCEEYDISLKSYARDKNIQFEILLGEIINIRNGA